MTQEEVKALVERALSSGLREDMAAAVRQSLDWFASAHPGRAVEVRVPPFRVVQILGGTTHRRGTPPAVVEMKPEVWLALATGRLTWDQAVADRRVSASGERSNLSELLPVL